MSLENKPKIVLCVYAEVSGLSIFVAVKVSQRGNLGLDSRALSWKEKLPPERP